MFHHNIYSTYVLPNIQPYTLTRPLVPVVSYSKITNLVKGNIVFRIDTQFINNY